MWERKKMIIVSSGGHVSDGIKPHLNELLLQMGVP